MSRYGAKPLVENAVKLNISTIIRNCIIDCKQLFKNKYSEELSLKYEVNIQKFVSLIEEYTNFTVTRAGETTYRTGTKITYTHSNLSRGFIFWFICDGCQNKVRNLYLPTHSDKFLCRNCHNLMCKKQNTSHHKKVAKLLSDPALMEEYARSSSVKKQLAVHEALLLKSSLFEKITDKVMKTSS